MFVRLTRTVQDRGVLVRPNEVSEHIIDRQVDWYQSPFTYGDDAKEYFESHDNSIKGYTGSVSTSQLYWDLDFKQDVLVAKKAAISLLAYLTEKGMTEGIEVFFSGNKGFHVFLKTTNEFNPLQTSSICYNIALQAKLPDGVFDTSVYNVNRVFRIVNTRHQDSGLYKIPITAEELTELTVAEISKLAAEPRFEEFDTNTVDASSFLEFAKAVDKPNLSLVKPGELISSAPSDLLGLHRSCPPGHRKCVHTLEQGYFGPSERHSAILRLAAYYKGQGYSRKHTGNLVFEALDKRSQYFTNLSPVDENECNRDIEQVYSADWKGGTFSCKTDIYLQSKCDVGQGPCFDDAKTKIRNVIGVDQLFNNYIRYSEEGLESYPEFGLEWLDSRIRLRPKNFSVVAGANGCHRKGEKVMMFDGSFKNAEDIRLGDLLMGPDSTPRKVLELFRGEDEMYAIYPRKGEPFYVNGDHILHWEDSHNKKHNRTVKDYITTHKNHAIFTSGDVMFRSEVEFKHRDVPIDPYFLGLWLGDGSSRCVSITTPDTEMREYTNKIADDWGLKVNCYNSGGTRTDTFHIVADRLKGQKNHLLKVFQELELIDNKHVPDLYKINSREVRLNLLAGLLDSDGHMHHNCFEFSNKKKHIAEAVVYISRSLGLAAYLFEVENGCWYKGEYKKGIYYRVSISGDTNLIPTKIARKQAKTRSQIKNPLRVGFRIEKVADKEPYYGFMLDKDHLYLDDSFNVLHNSGKTSLIIQLLENMNKQNIHHVMFSLDMADSSLFEKLAAKYTEYSQFDIETAFKPSTFNKEIVDEVRESIKSHLPFTLFDFTSAVSMKYVEQTISALKAVYDNLQIAIIDYASRLIAEHDNAYANSSANANAANDVAKRTRTHLLFLAQVSREKGDHTDPLRTSRVAKESGAWEENATAVMSLWRPFGNGIAGHDHYAHIYIGKNRSGPLGENVFNWEGKTGTFTEMQSEAEFEEYRQLCEAHSVEPPRFNHFSTSAKDSIPRPTKDFKAGNTNFKKFNDDVPVFDRGSQSQYSRERTESRVESPIKPVVKRHY